MQSEDGKHSVLKMFPTRPTWARTRTAFEGNRYSIACDWRGDGEVFSYDENRVLLRFRNEPTPKTLMYGWIRLPEFVVFSENGSEALRFRRTRRLPRQLFPILTAGNQVGQLVQTSPFYTSYELDLANGTKWKLRLPLFTIGFFGTSSDGGRLLFWLKSHRLWHLVVEPKYDSTVLLASLAFIHREYLRHG
jgi:hypothetical protein